MPLFLQVFVFCLKMHLGVFLHCLGPSLLHVRAACLHWRLDHLHLSPLAALQSFFSANIAQSYATSMVAVLRFLLTLLAMFNSRRRRPAVAVYPISAWASTRRFSVDPS